MKRKLSNLIKAGDLVKETYTENPEYYDIHRVFRLTQKGKQRNNDLTKSHRSYKKQYFVRQGASALYLYVIEKSITEIYRYNVNFACYDLIYKKDEKGNWQIVNR